MDSLCHPWFTTTSLSYRFPISETSAAALCGTTGLILNMFIASVCIGVLLLQWLRFSDCMGAASECVAWPKIALTIAWLLKVFLQSNEPIAHDMPFTWRLFRWEGQVAYKMKTTSPKEYTIKLALRSLQHMLCTLHLALHWFYLTFCPTCLLQPEMCCAFEACVWFNPNGRVPWCVALTRLKNPNSALACSSFCDHVILCMCMLYVYKVIYL